MRPTILVDAQSILSLLKVVPDDYKSSLDYTRIQARVDSWLEEDVSSHMCACCGCAYIPPSVRAFPPSVQGADVTCPNCLASRGNSAVVIEADAFREMTVPINNLRDALIQYLAEHVTDEDHDTYALVHEALCATKGNHIKDAIMQIVDRVESTLPKPHSI